MQSSKRNAASVAKSIVGGRIWLRKSGNYSFQKSAYEQIVGRGRIDLMPTA